MLCAQRLAAGERFLHRRAVFGAAALMRQFIEAVIHALQRRGIDLLATGGLAGFGIRRRPGIALAALGAVALTDQVPKFCMLGTQPGGQRAEFLRRQRGDGRLVGRRNHGEGVVAE